MGMFDHIKCEYPLPNASEEVQNSNFQTQDFYSNMDDYTVTREGKLILHKKIYEEVPEEERPYYGKPEWEKPIFQIMGALKAKHVADVDIQHHGYLNIYTILRRSNKYDPKDWYEYRLKFTDGKIESVEKVESKDE